MTPPELVDRTVTTLEVTREAAAAVSPVERLLALAGHALERPLTSADADTPLALLGLDSIRLVELLAAIEEWTGVTVPDDLADESTTIRELVSLIEDPSRHRPPSTADDRVALMLFDSRLPDDIVPERPRERRSLVDCTAVLLTGATGFLGGQIAVDLLQRSRAKLYCLVRGGGEPGGTRLRERLLAAGATHEQLATRVILIDGDLSQSDLGLPATVWRRLQSEVDAIVHAGASVNWIAPYSQLRVVNVLGTRALLRLASGASAIPFHFVSSLSVCYAAGGPAIVDEAFDALRHVRGLHLGYAQSKAAAEALVREAGRRGLPITIHRPSLISGHSRTGGFNGDDLLARLVRGCIAMGTAPDLDWSLDCEPVDVVSAEILALSDQSGEVTHLKHPAPRHWRECLLWMRLSGYDIRLVPYDLWIRQLDREIGGDAGHALAALRPFFAVQHDGLTLPEWYEDSRRSQAVSRCTDARLAGRVARPALNAQLLDRYFTAYREAGYLPAVARHGEARPGSGPFDAPFFASALARGGWPADVQSARCLDAGSEHSIIGELTAWRSGHAAGIFRYELELGTGAESRMERVILKVKPHADEATAVGEALAGLCAPPVADAYRRWRGEVGLADSHRRERAIYAQAPAQLTRYMPRLLGVADLDDRGSCALVLEDLTGARLLDSTQRTPYWRAEDIATAIDGLAAIHAATYGTARSAYSTWIGWPRTTDTMAQMSDFWRALAEHAAPAFTVWGGSDLPRTHRRLIDTIREWRSIQDAQIAAVVHNDCNPRNLCLRHRPAGLELCAYDWELATMSIPQRDLAELLCFVLPATAPGAVVDHWIEAHRRALAGRAGVAIAAEDWRRGFMAALNELLVDRLAMYALVHRVRAQLFLPRVIATWRRLHEHLFQAVAS